MKYPWGHNRRFNAYSNYFKKEFGERVQKVAVNAGFLCPNRDGNISYGGCTYCNNDAFNPSYCQQDKPIKQQIIEGIEFHERRYRRANKYLAYFQAFSNTYATIDRMKKVYNEALSNDKIVGLVIGTRPDCIDDEKLDYIKKISEEYYIIIEYGIESCYDKTLQRINRGHTFNDCIKAITLCFKLFKLFKTSNIFSSGKCLRSLAISYRSLGVIKPSISLFFKFVSAILYKIKDFKAL